jgi:hypothetical protein
LVLMDALAEKGFTYGHYSYVRRKYDMTPQDAFNRL